MCGITGAIDLTGRRHFPSHVIEMMTQALAHRGPDDHQIYQDKGIALGVRRLALRDVAHGRQPMANEDKTVWVAYEGELYDYAQLRAHVLDRGHRLQTQCDTELWVHLYEDYGEAVFSRVIGQFATALWDNQSQTLLLGRDRPGIAPLFYTEVDGWLLWASEAKALLASTLIDAKPDLKSIDFFFNFFCLPNNRSCFENIKSLAPGHYLKIHQGKIETKQYWDLDFPNAGEERRFVQVADAVDELEALLRQAIRRRFSGERPFCTYLSGGLDSTVLLGLATQEYGKPINAFSIGLDRSGPRDERIQACESARLLGAPLHTLSITSHDIATTYPELIRAAEGPVLDTSAACMIRLAQRVNQQGYVVALTGEGSDEALSGYVWFKYDQLLRRLSAPVYRAGHWLLLSGLVGGGQAHRPAWRPTAGVRTGQQFPYDMMAQTREWFYSDSMWQALDNHSSYDELNLPIDRMQRWHPLNQGLYLANKVMLPGMLLAAKGDRALHNASLEGRFPFLDEDVIAFCASLPPQFKLRGLTDKWLLRQVAAKILPSAIANRPKTMFRAHLSTTFLNDERPAWVDQLLSPESLQRAGYFKPQAVEKARQIQKTKARSSFQRFVLDMGLAGVIGTQLWHHIYCGGQLADLPAYSASST